MTRALKRFLVEKLAGSELRAVRARLRRFDEQHQASRGQLEQLAAGLARLERQLGAGSADTPGGAPGASGDSGTGAGTVVDALRRLHAEQRLQSQVHRIDGLHLQGPARSVLFLHNSYYHFYYLAQALRRRGWRAMSASFEDPNGVNAQYYHGEDVNLWDPDAQQLRANALVLFEFAKAHFDLMHFAGDGLLSFFPWNFEQDDPADILEWRALGKSVGYTISGCNSATSQTSFHAWSATGRGRSACDNCPWQMRPEVCSDEMNLAWGRRVHAHCDLVFTELQPSLDLLSARHANVVRGPCTMVLDEKLWADDLEIPQAFRVERAPGEVLIYHAFGNYAARGMGERNIKGTPAILAAIERLQHEGFPVRLMFFSKVPNEIVRYYQAQADIVVDQLWAGSWGANGRESLMLGKPVVGFVNRHENDPADVLPAIAESPILNATEETIYEVLKALVLDPERRRQLSRASREFALPWPSAGAGARRYEEAYDRMLARRINSERPAR